MATYFTIFSNYILWFGNTEFLNKISYWLYSITFFQFLPFRIESRRELFVNDWATKLFDCKFIWIFFCQINYAKCTGSKFLYYLISLKYLFKICYFELLNPYNFRFDICKKEFLRFWEIGFIWPLITYFLQLRARAKTRKIKS